MKKAFKFFKSLLLLVVLFYLSYVITKSIVGVPVNSKINSSLKNSDEVFFAATSLTVLIAFIYSKIAKKFNL